jgi:hypothetical protein
MLTSHNIILLNPFKSLYTVNNMDLLEQINKHSSIYLSNISESEENCLRLIIEEGSFVGDGKPMDPFMREVLGLASTDEASNCIYEILFNNYICYAVLNQSYVIAQENSNCQDDIFGCHSQSNYLHYVKQHSQLALAQSDSLKHYKLKCLHHIIDIATFDKPLIKNIGSRTANNGISLR